MFSCNLLPALLAEWPGSFTAVTQGWNEYWNKTTETLPWRRKFSCHSCRNSNPWLWPFSHKSGAVTTELSLLPLVIPKTCKEFRYISYTQSNLICCFIFHLKLIIAWFLTNLHTRSLSLSIFCMSYEVSHLFSYIYINHVWGDKKTDLVRVRRWICSRMLMSTW